MSPNYFLNTIKHLFEHEEVLLFQDISKISKSEKENVSEFLKSIYKEEVLAFPFDAPELDVNAAVWASEFVYKTAQLILYREDSPDDLSKVLPEEDFVVTPSTLVSVDLCFRFIPDLWRELKLIDSEDELVPILEKQLRKWHYSAISTNLEIEEDWNSIKESVCLTQLYVNRVIRYKNKKLAKIPWINHEITAHIGLYEDQFWPNFKLIELDD